ncbi:MULTISPECIES: DUF4747 family protein [Halomonadaceae]|uniref:DUF4747 family protein n=1 Tax=Halomonadaceae TaxID=28256 RepID=UPI001C254E41|nr:MULTISPECIES: DUF4747 family protein [Halomonas]
MENPDIERVTKKSLLIKYPPPDLRVTPLSDKESLRSFVNRLQHIDKLTIKLLPTNKEEIDNDDFWVDLGRRREEMNSSSAKVDFSNTKEGLNGDKVYEQAKSASSFGNSELKFKGYDAQGDTIRGSNEDFSLTVEMDSLPRSAELAGKQKYLQFLSLVGDGVISLPKVHEGVIQKLKAIIGKQ